MKVIGNPPEEMLELFKQVCKDYKRGLPSEFIWKPRNGVYTGGTTWSQWYRVPKKLKNGKMRFVQQYGKVLLRAGTEPQDQKLVMLHELSHHIVGKSAKGRAQGHTMKFWKLAFELYERYGVDMDYAYNREEGYKKRATQAYAHHMAAKKETI